LEALEVLDGVLCIVSETKQQTMPSSYQI